MLACPIMFRTLVCHPRLSHRDNIEMHLWLETQCTGQGFQISHTFWQEYYPNIRNLGFVNSFAHFAAEARITFVPNEVNATTVAGRSVLSPGKCLVAGYFMQVAHLETSAHYLTESWICQNLGRTRRRSSRSSSSGISKKSHSTSDSDSNSNSTRNCNRNSNTYFSDSFRTCCACTCKDYVCKNIHSQNGTAILAQVYVIT